jgi:arylsulfatase A
MNRRELFQCAGVSLAALVAPSGGAIARNQNQRKPNIIFILADDLGYGDLGCTGQKAIRTPNIDRMAAEGMHFTQHYAGCTVCAPSRCALLTGLHTGHAYIRGNGPTALRDDPQDISVFRMLKDVGYHTGLIGKSGLSGNIEDGGHPNRKGCDYFFGFVSHAAAHRHYPETLFRNGTVVRYPGNSGKEGDTFAEAEFVKDALRFITENKDRPFLLHYAPTLPHADLAAPESYKKPYEGQFPETPFPGNHYRAEPRPKATYAAMVSYLDWEVGQILAKLRELGIEKETLVLVASDNGAMQEGGYNPAFFRSSGDLRGGKRDMYEGGIRTPLIAWWPGKIASGTTTDHLSAFWDFPATACEVAGAPAPKNTDSLSYLPVLLGGSGQQRHDYLYWEFHEQGGKRAVRVGDWKMIQLNVAKDPQGPVEVYNLKTDPSEKTDVAMEHPVKVAEARRLFQTAAVPSKLFPFPNNPAATR